MDDKKDFKTILTSKTIWVNLLAIVCFVLQERFNYVIEPTTQVEILGVINILLRTITKKEIRWSNK